MFNQQVTIREDSPNTLPDPDYVQGLERLLSGVNAALSRDIVSSTHASSIELGFDPDYIQGLERLLSGVNAALSRDIVSSTHASSIVLGFSNGVISCQEVVWLDLL